MELKLAAGGLHSLPHSGDTNMRGAGMGENSVDIKAAAIVGRLQYDPSWRLRNEHVRTRGTRVFRRIHEELTSHRKNEIASRALHGQVSLDFRAEPASFSLFVCHHAECSAETCRSEGGWMKA
jgi:hypothetical protein